LIILTKVRGIRWGTKAEISFSDAFYFTLKGEGDIEGESFSLNCGFNREPAIKLKKAAA
jgi:hypothetical protein